MRSRATRRMSAYSFPVPGPTAAVPRCARVQCVSTCAEPPKTLGETDAIAISLAEREGFEPSYGGLPRKRFSRGIIGTDSPHIIHFHPYSER